MNVMDQPVSPIPPTTQPASQTIPSANGNTATTDKKTVTVVGLLLLSLIFPLFGVIGVILMWRWMKWRRAVKWVITLPIVLLDFLPLTAGVFFVFYIFLLRPFQVNGDSMLPTYQAQEYVLTGIPAKSSLKHGDVIVYRSPVDENRDFIKRVIGFPGEKVKIAQGDVYVNGQLIDESAYLAQPHSTSGGAFLQDSEEVTVPSDSYFVLGDNRPYSSDSREYGFILKKDVISKVLLCYYNCKK